MKQLGLAVGLIALVAASILVARVSAHEGRIVLKNSTVACEGISVWRDRYRIVGRCSGLVYPYGEKINKYLLWVIPDGETQPTRVASIEVGQFDGQIEKSFSQIFVTAEQDTSPRQPSDLTIASGNVTPFDFSPAQITLPPAPVGQPSPTPSPGMATVGQNLKRLLITVAILVGILGAIVVGFIILSRRG